MPAAWIETAKANGSESWAYLLHLFTELPKAQTPADIDALLPQHAEIPDGVR